MDNLNYEDYLAVLNTKFIVQVEAQNVELDFYQVGEKKTSPGQESFSLEFRGPKDKFLPQMLYHLKHEKLGDGAIFLVPVGEDAEGLRYQAVFNRLVRA